MGKWMSARLRRTSIKRFRGGCTGNYGRRKTCSYAERVGKSCVRPYCRKPVTPTRDEGRGVVIARIWRNGGGNAIFASRRVFVRYKSLRPLIRVLVRYKRRC